MSKLAWIIGMRRSGTSILRRLVMSHNDVMNIDFEPHELIYCCRTNHIKRYNNSEYHKKTINKYKDSNYSKYTGAKIAVNVGIEAMNWRWLNRHFPNSKFIFIKRNLEDNFNSWYKQDKKSVRGICSFEMYKDWYNLINNSFVEFNKENPKKSCLLSYESIVDDADKELEKVWDVLDVLRIEGLNRQINKPKNWSVK